MRQKRLTPGRGGARRREIGVISRFPAAWDPYPAHLTLEEVHEEARRRIQSKPGFFASLSPEARELIRNFDGPEMLGPPEGKFRL
jgi:hypothetical protein